MRRRQCLPETRSHALAFEWLADHETHFDPFVRVETGRGTRARGRAGRHGGRADDGHRRGDDGFRPADGDAAPAYEDRCADRLFGRGGRDHGDASRSRDAHPCVAMRATSASHFKSPTISSMRRAMPRLRARRCARTRQRVRRPSSSLLGLDRAKAQAAMLVDQAVAHLGSFGHEADLLRAIARYAVERDR